MLLALEYLLKLLKQQYFLRIQLQPRVIDSVEKSLNQNMTERPQEKEER